MRAAWWSMCLGVRGFSFSMHVEVLFASFYFIELSLRLLAYGVGPQAGHSAPKFGLDLI